MDIQSQQHPQLDRIAELVKEMKFAMLTTEEPDGALRSRPMSTMQMDGEGNLWFFTALSSHKVAEAQQHRQVNLAYARSDKQDYLSISGTVEIVRDKQKMQELWSVWVKPWFPDGLDDPDLVLMKVSITEAEYWDSPGSTAMQLYGLAKGIMTGNTDAMGENRRVIM
jgi:general stress protein 26